MSSSRCPTRRSRLQQSQRWTACAFSALAALQAGAVFAQPQVLVARAIAGEFAGAAAARGASRSIPLFLEAGSLGASRSIPLFLEAGSLGAIERQTISFSLETLAARAATESLIADNFAELVSPAGYDNLHLGGVASASVRERLVVRQLLDLRTSDTLWREVEARLPAVAAALDRYTRTHPPSVFSINPRSDLVLPYLSSYEQGALVDLLRRQKVETERFRRNGLRQVRSEARYRGYWFDFLTVDELVAPERVADALRQARALGVFENQIGKRPLGFLVLHTDLSSTPGLLPADVAEDVKSWSRRWASAYEWLDSLKVRRLISGLTLRLERLLRDETAGSAGLAQAIERTLDPSYKPPPDLPPPPPAASPAMVEKFFGTATALGTDAETLALARDAERTLRQRLGVSVLGPSLKSLLASASPEAVDTLARLVLGLRPSLGSASWTQARQATASWLVVALEVTPSDAEVRLDSLIACGLLTPALSP